LGRPPRPRQHRRNGNSWKRENAWSWCRNGPLSTILDPPLTTPPPKAMPPPHRPTFARPGWRRLRGLRPPPPARRACASLQAARIRTCPPEGPADHAAQDRLAEPAPATKVRNRPQLCQTRPEPTAGTVTPRSVGATPPRERLLADVVPNNTAVAHPGDPRAFLLPMGLPGKRFGLDRATVPPPPNRGETRRRRPAQNPPCFSPVLVCCRAPIAPEDRPIVACSPATGC